MKKRKVYKLENVNKPEKYVSNQDKQWKERNQKLKTFPNDIMNQLLFKAFSCQHIKILYRKFFQLIFLQKETQYVKILIKVVINDILGNIINITIISQCGRRSIYTYTK